LENPAASLTGKESAGGMGEVYPRLVLGFRDMVASRGLLPRALGSRNFMKNWVALRGFPIREMVFDPVMFR
jgi:hypothetical protein